MLVFECISGRCPQKVRSKRPEHAVFWFAKKSRDLQKSTRIFGKIKDIFRSMYDSIRSRILEETSERLWNKMLLNVFNIAISNMFNSGDFFVANICITCFLREMPIKTKWTSNPFIHFLTDFRVKSRNLRVAFSQRQRDIMSCVEEKPFKYCR